MIFDLVICIQVAAISPFSLAHILATISINNQLELMVVQLMREVKRLRMMLSVGTVQYAVSGLTVSTHSMPRRAAAVARIRLDAARPSLSTLVKLTSHWRQPSHVQRNLRLYTPICVFVTSTDPDQALRLKNEYERKDQNEHSGSCMATGKSLSWDIRCFANMPSIGHPSVSLHRL